VSVQVDAASVIDRIAGAVREKKCILFLGAGVHAPPPDGSPFTYPEEQRLPLGPALSERLARDCHLAEHLPDEDPRNLQRVALCYQIVCGGRQPLVNEIRNAVQVGKQPSPMLRALATLDFPLVITTNYDQLFEMALAGKQPRVSVYSPEPQPTVDYRDPTPESPIIFKLHGDISRPESLVVTDEDYIQFVLRMNDKDPYDPIPLNLKYFLTNWTTLFVGYSLLDYNLRLLFKTLRWRVDPANRPETYSVDYAPDPLVFDVWDKQEHYVTFIAQDVWAFVPRLYKLVTGKDLKPGEELKS